MNITVKPTGGLGRKAKPGSMTFPSLGEIKPSLRAFFSSRFVIVEAGQSPGVGATAETSGAPPLRCIRCNLGSSATRSSTGGDGGALLLTISGCVWECESGLKNCSSGTVAMRRKNKEGREAVKEKNMGSKIFFSFIKGELPRDL
jgi:hypothetical protein